MLNQLLLLALLMVYKVPEGCVASESSELPEINTSVETTVSIQSNSLQQQGCGKSMVEQRHENIVGGEPAELGAWPWIATLGFKLGSDDFFYDCGASLISARHVITARHCVSELLSFVRLGDLNLSPDVKDGASPVDYIIEEEIMHPKSDIAILRLQKDVTFTNLIQPICLPSAPEIKGNTWAGYEPFVAGWGMTEPWKVTVHKGENKMLRQVRVPVWDNQRCKSVYNDETRGYLVDETMMCAGLADGGKDSCQGDSGGPLMVSLGKNSSYYLIGIVSWGQGCARPNVPGVYVRVSKFLDWIEKVTK